MSDTDPTEATDAAAALAYWAMIDAGVAAWSVYTTGADVRTAS